MAEAPEPKIGKEIEEIRNLLWGATIKWEIFRRWSQGRFNMVIIKLVVLRVFSSGPLNGLFFVFMRRWLLLLRFRIQWCWTICFSAATRRTMCSYCSSSSIFIEKSTSRNNKQPNLRQRKCIIYTLSHFLSWHFILLSSLPATNVRHFSYSPCAIFLWSARKNLFG